MKENKYDNITLIIQGPLTSHTLASIYRYRDNLAIVVVCPNEKTPNTLKILNEITQLCADNKYNISLLIYPETMCKDSYNNKQNKYYHFYSTCLGLLASGKEFSVKMRSDEFYSNLIPIFNNVIKHPTKVITNDVFFRSFVKYPYHSSDHIVGGKTTLLLNAFKLAKEVCENFDNSLRYPIFKKSEIIKDRFVPEHILALSIISTKYSTATIEEHFSDKFLMKDTFIIIKVSELGVFHIKQNSAHPEPKTYTDTTYYDPAQDVQDIEDY